jgi:hypothetical protein
MRLRTYVVDEVLMEVTVNSTVSWVVPKRSSEIPTFRMNIAFIFLIEKSVKKESSESKQQAQLRLQRASTGFLLGFLSILKIEEMVL